MNRKTSLVDAIGIAGLLAVAFVVLNVLSAALSVAGCIVRHGDKQQ